MRDCGHQRQEAHARTTLDRELDFAEQRGRVDCLAAVGAQI